MPTKVVQSEARKIPKLRFSGFSGGWENKNLGEVSAKPMYGMNAPAKEYDGENIYLRITDIDQASGSLKKDGLTSPDAELEDVYRLKEGDLLFTRTGASVGKTYLYKKTDGKLYFAGFLIKFSIENASPYFIYFLTLQKKYLKFVESVSMRSGQPGINAKEYADFKINLPPLLEQQKIAEFLRVTDEWIENLRTQKESLESYKKGMMQKIFAQEIRFKDGEGNEFPEWEEKRLGEVGEIVGGGTPSTGRKDYWSGTIPWISSSDLEDGDINKINIHRYITESAIENSATKKIPKGSVLLISRVGVGKVAVTSTDVCVSQDFQSIIPRKDEINSIFLAYYLQVKVNKLLQYNQGTSIKGFTKKDMQELLLAIPSFSEQKKIAEFLTSIDKIIESKQQQITQAEQWKKGLVQGLFV